MATTALGGSPVPIDYTSRDYSSIKSDLIGAIPTFNPSWTSTSEADFGVTLIELFSYVADISSYYIDRVANEAFLPTATQMSSVLNLAYLIDYAPAGVSPSSTVMQLSVAASNPSFVLPVGTQFSTTAANGAAPLIFETSALHTIPAAAGSINSTTENGVSVPITVVQGITVTAEAMGNSDGSASQSFTLFNTSVIESTVAVYVTSSPGASGLPGTAQPWLMVGHLIDAGPYDNVYDLAIDANGVVYVRFGDGSNGAIPPSGALISANYRYGGGALTNVGANQITVDLSNSGYLTAVTNPAAAAGGSDAETVAQIQANAPQSLTAAGRCVSLQDYASVALQLPGVSKANAVASVPTSVTLYIHPAGGPYVTSTLVSMVTALATQLTTGLGGTGYLDNKVMAGTSVSVVPPTYDGTAGAYLLIYLTMTVQVLPQYQGAVVQQNVLQAIASVVDFGSVSFAQRVTLSSMYHACQAVAGVDYLVITEMRRADASAGTLGDVVCTASELPIVADPSGTVTTNITVNSTGGL